MCANEIIQKKVSQQFWMLVYITICRRKLFVDPDFIIFFLQISQLLYPVKKKCFDYNVEMI